MRISNFTDFLSESESKSKTILILIAMNDEALPAIKSLGLSPLPKQGKMPFMLYGGEHQGKKIVLMTSGKDAKYNVDNVGTQVASSMATVGIQQFSPDIVINAGTAGAFSEAKSTIGSVYIGSIIKYHDRRIPIPGFEEYGKGDYESVNIPESVKNLFPQAVVSTGNSLDITDAERKSMAELAKKGPIVKEMEAAAIAQVCSWNETPLLVLKSVTDIIDGSEQTADEFQKNLQIASGALQDALLKVIGKI